MYESYPCSRCSYNDIISCSGSRGFYLDPVEDYGTDHFHSRESVPRSFSRSVYVWCSGKLLRAYQKFLIAFIFSLIISCPAFAEDENYQFQYIGYEAMANQGMDVNQYLIDQYQEERNSEIAQILSEPLANNSILRTPINSVNVLADISQIGSEFYVTGSVRDSVDPLFNYWYVNYNFNGSDPMSHILASGIGRSFSTNFMFNDFNSNTHMNVFYSTAYPVSPSDTRLWSLNYFPSEHTTITSSDFLSSVSFIFTWLLDHIAEIITFILGNAFLSVSLLLFMCGAVISFYVRIRRS